MMYREVLDVQGKADSVTDVTKHVNEVIARSTIKEGLCHIFLKGTTAGLMVNENDRMLFADFQHLMEKAAPKEKIYQHPSNGHAHLRASMLHQHVSIPVSNQTMFLGKGQSVLFFEFDTERSREIVVTVLGE
ncbi:MAG: YjbQ family protein [Candidatus Aenigmarchaeota archaeon]|nr:YjbQ family protein [Candidatus Aenigmarchaeota archaeon]